MRAFLYFENIYCEVLGQSFDLMDGADRLIADKADRRGILFFVPFFSFFLLYFLSLFEQLLLLCFTH